MNAKQTTKHTPGPWNTGRMLMRRQAWAEMNDPKHGLHVVQKGQDVIAVVWGNSENGENDAAQAAFIASAPTLLAERDRLKAERDELLNALKDVMPAVEASIDYEVEEAEVEEFIRARDTARALIAKIEGAK